MDLSKFRDGRVHVRNSGVGERVKGIDTLGSFSIIFNKGDNFCVFLFAFLHTKSLLKRGLEVDPFQREDKINFDSYLPGKCLHSP